MIVLMNQVLSQANVLSGGEKITVELVRKWKDLMNIVLVMPENGLSRIKEGEDLNVNYDTLPLIFMDKEKLYWKHIFLVPLAWFIHALNCWKKISKLKIKDKKIYSSGDFFCNTIPAFLKKSQDNEIQWSVSIFHIIDSPFKRKGGHSFLSNLFSKALQNLSFFLIKQKADVVFVLNNDLKNHLSKQGFKLERMHILGAGIDFKQIDAVPAEEPVYDACFMARLSTTKGIAEIPRIWKRVVEKVKTAKLLVIGDGLGSDVKDFKKAIIELGLNDQINLVGAKIGQEKYRLIKLAKLFIFPSFEEGFAISILEAMTCKTPVIAWNLPVYETIYGKHIFMVNKPDVEAFSDQIIDLLSNEGIRKEYARQGYVFAQNYDWKAVAEKGFDIINSKLR